MSTIPDPIEDFPTFTIPGGVVASQAAFHRMLPELLQKQPGKWVAFHGDKLIGFARAETELYQICLKRGLTEEQFIVRQIRPDSDMENSTEVMYWS